MNPDSFFQFLAVDVSPPGMGKPFELHGGIQPGHETQIHDALPAAGRVLHLTTDVLSNHAYGQPNTTGIWGPYSWQPRTSAPQRVNTDINPHENPLRVMLAEGDIPWHDYVISILQGTEFDVVGEALSGPEAIEVTRLVRPDLILLNVCAVGAIKGGLINALMREQPSVQIILTSSCYSQTEAAEALNRGAVAYLPKDIRPEALISALRNAARGQLLARRIKSCGSVKTKVIS